MTKGPLGFGWMRLPVLSDDPTDIDFEQVNQMVDEFLDAGFTYFDTSFVYHNGKSENAIRKCLVSRHDRDSYTIASKLPIFTITEEQQVVDIFEKQLENCGVDYFDYFLLHNMNWIRYNDEVKRCHMFEHLKQWKDEGKIRHIGFSYHDDAESLDKILAEHPEIEFVQIALNYIDWDTYFIQAKACYDVIRKHGRQVIVMEPVKGGMLAKAPAEVEAMMKEAEPDMSVASWAIRFAASLPDVLTVLSGMSDLAQVEDNISYMKDFRPLSEEDLELLEKANRLYRESGPVGTADFSKYECIDPRGVSAAAILDAYNNCMLQPVVTFGAEGNYFSLQKAEQGVAVEDRCIPGQAIASDGTDVTEQVHEAEDFLTKCAFAQYEPMAQE